MNRTINPILITTNRKGGGEKKEIIKDYSSLVKKTIGGGAGEWLRG